MDFCSRAFFMVYLLIILLTIIGIAVVKSSRNITQKVTKDPRQKDMPLAWPEINQHLSIGVPFYINLDTQKQIEFQERVATFINSVNFSWVDCTFDERDQILIAASAVIPVFKFKKWEYSFLNEVIVYPKAFNRSYETEGDDRTILGMVGNGPLEGKVLLSLEAIRHGFWNSTDKLNTAIHEFVHLIDKEDGKTDGIPMALLKREEIGPWVELMRTKTQEIKTTKTGISTYALTNDAEFFSVVSEYFFERPKLLKKKHSELYRQLNHIYSPDN